MSIILVPYNSLFILFFLNIIKNITCKHIWGHNLEKYQNLKTVQRRSKKYVFLLTKTSKLTKIFKNRVEKREENFCFSVNADHRVLNLRYIIEVILTKKGAFETIEKGVLKSILNSHFCFTHLGSIKDAKYTILNPVKELGNIANKN